MPIHGIFYARFLPQLGTKIVAQSPPGCIVPVAVADESDDEDQQQQSQLHRSASAALIAAATASATSGSPGGGGASQHHHGSHHSHHHEHGGGSHAPKSAPRGKPLFEFDVMQEYVIPRSAFFNRYLAAREPNGRYAVLGLPVAIRDAKYHRNEFIFNFGIVVDADADQGPYEKVVRRLASTFAEMEKQNEYLSQEEQRGAGSGGGGGALSHPNSSIEPFLDQRRVAASGHRHPYQPLRNLPGSSSSGLTVAAPSSAGANPGGKAPSAPVAGHSPYHRRSIQSLLEIIKEDLNLYGECMIPVDDANTINMKLFPQHADPPPVEGWHVPVPKMRLADAVDPSWDLTLQRVIAHMDGVSDVRRIAFEADISLELCRAALRHFLYYDTVLLLDMFFFGSCYAPRPGIHDFVANVGGIVDECARYVCLGHQRYSAHGGYSHYDNYSHNQEFHGLGGRDPDDASAKQRQHASHGHGHTSNNNNNNNNSSSSSSNNNNNNNHTSDLAPRISNFDLIRLMVSFCAGRTVTEWLKGHADAGFDVLRYVDVRRLVQFGVIKGCLYRVHKYVVSKQYLAQLVTGQAEKMPDSSGGGGGGGGDPLQKYTDGNHHFDQIITEQNLTEVEIVEKLKRLPLPPGDLKVLYR